MSHYVVSHYAVNYVLTRTRYRRETHEGKQLV